MNTHEYIKTLLFTKSKLCILHRSRALREATKLALSGRLIYNGVSEQALTTNFELLNLVPSDHPYHAKISDTQAFQRKSTSSTGSTHHKAKRSTSSTATTKGANVISTPRWRRVGLVSASSVQLDTIVWPGGDIVVSGRYGFHFLNPYFLSTSKLYLHRLRLRVLYGEIDIKLLILQVCRPELERCFGLWQRWRHHLSWNPNWTRMVYVCVAYHVTEYLQSVCILSMRFQHLSLCVYAIPSIQIYVY